MSGFLGQFEVFTVDWFEYNPAAAGDAMLVKNLKEIFEGDRSQENIS